MVFDDILTEGFKKLCQFYHELTYPNDISLKIVVWDDIGTRWRYGPLSGEFERFNGFVWETGHPLSIERVEIMLKAYHPITQRLYGYTQQLDPHVIVYEDNDDFFKHIVMSNVRQLVLSMYGV